MRRKVTFFEAQNRLSAHRRAVLLGEEIVELFVVLRFDWGRVKFYFTPCTFSRYFTKGQTFINEVFPRFIFRRCVSPF